MRRIVIMVGILLTSTILISGSTVAPYVDHYEAGSTSNCTNPAEAEGAPDNNDATVGVNPSTLGILLLDLDSGNEMGPNQQFTVYGFSGSDNHVENYTIKIYNARMDDSAGPWSGDDDSNQVFQTPALPNTPNYWRYFEITGTFGIISYENTEDIYYGPEIDAVGY